MLVFGGVRDWFSRCNLSILIQGLDFSSLQCRSFHIKTCETKPAQAHRIFRFPRRKSGPRGDFWSKKNPWKLGELTVYVKTKPFKTFQNFVKCLLVLFISTIEQNVKFPRKIYQQNQNHQNGTSTININHQKINTFQSQRRKTSY